MSDDLIDRLANDLKPVARNAVLSRIVPWLAAGIVAGAIVMVTWIGIRPDMPAAFADPIFWVKFAYPLLIGLVGLYAVERLSRPGITVRRSWLVAIGLFAVSALLGAMQLMMSPPEMSQTLIMGATALVCPFYIVGISLPIFAATILVMRTLAPTNLTLAGLAAGLLAGGAGAWIYSFHCGENGLPFLAIWYTLGIVAVTAIGTISGRYLLRW
jgi:hypothetical protein